MSTVDPYLLTVLTLTAETPDFNAALAAAWSEKPAGVNLELQTVSGPTWADATANYATWDAVTTAKNTWNDLIAAIP